jgi:thiamine biosynthesis lipoprotein
LLNNEDIEITSFQGEIMGTTYNVIINTHGSNHLESHISEILGSFNASMSTYIDNSLISKINKSEINEWIYVNDDFIEIIEYATELCIKTDGIYDVTIGKLVNKWGFGPDQIQQKPTEAQLLGLTKQVGCNSIEINDDKNSVRRVKDIALDFSSIAKGFAIDRVYLFLSQEKKLDNFFIELGGEIRTTRLKNKNEPWKLGIVSPIDPTKLIYTLYSDKYEIFAMATSGNYMNVRVFDDLMLSHTIDTGTGIPNALERKSVSVIANNAMKADALATALNAMKFETAVKYANNNRIKALFITEDIGKAKLVFSNELQKVKI